jgi:hypothetical protein
VEDCCDETGTETTTKKDYNAEKADAWHFALPI